MDFPFVIPTHPQIPLVLRTRIWRAAIILTQGTPLGKASRRKFVLPLAEGTRLTLELKPNVLNLVPDVVCGDRTIHVAPSLPVYQNALAYLPLLLIFGGGVIGGFCGATAAIINLTIFNSHQSTILKIFLALLVCLTAVTVWVIASLLFHFVLTTLARHPGT